MMALLGRILSMKKISIISPVFNPGKMLWRNLESVLRQDYLSVEHVVVDGGSTDGSVDVLKEYERRYEEAGKKLIWISAPDRGISDAVNKASAMSSGDLMIFFIDVFVDDHTISEIVEKFEKDNIDYTFGGLLYQENGRIIRRWSGKPGNWHFGFMLATPTLCYTRSVWEKHGPYSENYICANDYDFQLKLLKDKSLRYQSIAKPLVIYYAGGISNNSFQARWKWIKESQRVLKDNQVPFATFTNCCKTGIALCAYIFASHKKIEMEEWMK